MKGKFALEAREECTGHENPWFWQQWQAWNRGTDWWFLPLVQLCGSQQTSSVFISPLHQCHWDRGIKWRRLLSPKHVVLRIPPKTHFPIHSATIFNHNIACLPAFILLSCKTITSQANSPYSSLLLSCGPGKGKFYGLWNLIIANSYNLTIIFSLCWSEKWDL